MPSSPTTQPAAGPAPQRRSPLGRKRLVSWLRPIVLLRLALVAMGAGAGFALLGVLWPESDPSGGSQAPDALADLAKPPSRAVTVLVIGVDADQLQDPNNKAAPAGAANADALLLLRVNPGGPLQVLNLPTALAVQLPGSSGLKSLGSLYREGGVALTADAARNLVGLTSTEPDRYLVLSRGALRSLVDGLGALEVNPGSTMAYEDKRQGFKIDLQSGVQRLKGAQVEQLVRYRDPGRPIESRSANQEAVMRSLLKELSSPGRSQDIPALVQSLRGQVESNLTPTEVLSLMAATLRPDQSVSFATVPLAPPPKASAKDSNKAAAGGSELRQVAKAAPSTLWPPPGGNKPTGT